MRNQIVHDIQEESIEAKARWFQNLSMDERMQNLCDFTELAMALNPKIGDQRIVKSFTGRIQILSAS